MECVFVLVKVSGYASGEGSYKLISRTTRRRIETRNEIIYLIFFKTSKNATLRL